MQNKILVQKNLAPKQVLKCPEYVRLLDALNTFSSQLRSFGYEVSPYSAFSLSLLPKVSPENVDRIVNHFESWSRMIGPHLEIELPSSSRLELEISFAKEVLDGYGLKADDEFWKTLEEDQIIEIYGSEMIQIHRSLNFFKYCGYSLLDISLNEWYVLWERPKMILDKISEQIQLVISEYVPVKTLPIHKHVLREILDTGDTVPFVPRATICEFKHIGSLRKSAFSSPSGLICTATADVIARGDEARAIGFV
jgi:hypothetical protein